MNIAFFGTSEFAVESLKAILASRHKVVSVITQPDRKKGRRLKVSPSPVKVAADSARIPVFQPLDASSAETIGYLRTLSAELFVVVSFGQILSREVLAIPGLYSINLHSSLLPKYRGAAPINWAIMNGDTMTGVTVMKMNERMDEGDILLARETKIDEEETGITLGERLSQMGARTLLEALDLIGTGKAQFRKQDGSLATYAPKLTKINGKIDWSEPAAKIHNRVRGLLPWPGAYTAYRGMLLKILKTSLFEAPLDRGIKSGEVVDIVKNKGLVVKAGVGSLLIECLQLEGKKALDADSFLRGHRIAKGHIFD